MRIELAAEPLRHFEQNRAVAGLDVPVLRRAAPGSRKYGDRAVARARANARQLAGDLDAAIARIGVQPAVHVLQRDRAVAGVNLHVARQVAGRDAAVARSQDERAADPLDVDRAVAARRL